MTDDEVELIYNYLHENYEYRDRELINITKGRGRKVGVKLGCFSFTDGSKKPKVCTLLRIKGNRFNVKVSFLIYLYHFRRYPVGIHFKDGNVRNLDGNNLVEVNLITRRANKVVNKPYKIVANGFSTSIRFNYKFYHLGVFVSDKYAKEAHALARIELFKNNNLTAKELRAILSCAMDANCTSDRKIKSGIKGYHKCGDMYHSQITIAGNRRFIGSFSTPEEAHAAYLKAKEEYK